MKLPENWKDTLNMEIPKDWYKHIRIPKTNVWYRLLKRQLLIFAAIFSLWIIMGFIPRPVKRIELCIIAIDVVITLIRFLIQKKSKGASYGTDQTDLFI